MNPDQLFEISCGPNRRLIQVNDDGLDEALRLLSRGSAKKDLSRKLGILLSTNDMVDKCDNFFDEDLDEDEINNEMNNIDDIDMEGMFDDK